MPCHTHVWRFPQTKAKSIHKFISVRGPFVHLHPKDTQLSQRQSYYAVSLFKNIIKPWANLLEAQSINNFS